MGSGRETWMADSGSQSAAREAALFCRKDLSIFLEVKVRRVKERGRKKLNRRLKADFLSVPWIGENP